MKETLLILLATVIPFGWIILASMMIWHLLSRRGYFRQTEAIH
jgi:hypothetical protein